MITPAQVEELRAQTPGCDSVVHFNHAGASLPSRGMLDTIIAHLEDEARLGPMEAALRATDRLDAVRHETAALLNARPHEIAFGPSGSALWGAAFAALPPFVPGDRILVGRQEWGGNLATMKATAARTDATIETMPVREDGGVDAERLAELIDHRVRLISLTWLPANGGLINDAAAVGRLARAAGIPYFIDAGQAVGQIPADVTTLHCDVLKAAGRKHLRGPRGTALLYASERLLPSLQPVTLDVLSAPLVEGEPRIRPDARRFETSEHAVALRLGLGSAIAEARQIGIEAIRTRISGLAARLRQALATLPDVSVLDLGGEKSGIVSFALAGRSAAAVQKQLADRGIHIGANGVAYTPLDMTARGLTEIARASLSYLSTEAEIDRLCEALGEIIAGKG